ncbi:MAG TPA: NosD domain-containing protein, partial [Candidatus Hodarchaeales archaeon]|nr:NosD domain-containing protein [Candidatus Hodarchaeales archaeon]
TSADGSSQPSGNIISGNTIYTSIYGVRHFGSGTAISSNNIHDNDYGVFLESSDGLEIHDNAIDRNGIGLQLSSGSDSSLIYSNLVTDQFSHGVLIDSGNSNNFLNNTFRNNQQKTNDPNDERNFEIVVRAGSSMNKIEWNNFISSSACCTVDGKKTQVLDNGTGTVISHNFYDDWTTPDDNVDGIVDRPYSISGTANNFDAFPLTDPINLVHSFSAPMLLFPVGGEVVVGTIIISWTPSVDNIGHAVTYSVFQSSTLTSGAWVSITTGLTATSFIWDTTTVADEADYQIRVVASDGHDKTALSTSGTFEIDNLPHLLSAPAFTFPIAGSEASGVVTVTWDAAVDTLGHAVFYTISFSLDGGQS